jgi:hypothetical protein
MFFLQDSTGLLVFGAMPGFSSDKGRDQLHSAHSGHSAELIAASLVHNVATYAFVKHVLMPLLQETAWHRG